jgi:hypothetical protein
MICNTPQPEFTNRSLPGQHVDFGRMHGMRRIVMALRLIAALGLIACVPACGPRDAAPPPAWSEPLVAVPAPVAEGSRYPNLARAPDGTVVMSWVTPAADGAYALMHSTWTGNEWTPAATVSTGTNWLINWADFASVVPANGDIWAAHWLEERKDSAYAYDVRIVVSRDRGHSWSAPMTPHDDDTPTEHGFVSMVPDGGQLMAVWLDGRKTDGGTDHGSAHGAMTLRSVTMDDGGRLSGAGAEIDARVCDCCQTDAAMTADGPVIAYRDRDEHEIRDISIVRPTRDAWSAPQSVHRDGWRIDACPVNGPAVAALDRTVAVAWFTAPDAPRVRLAFSTDSGRTFAAPLEVATGRIAGRVDVVLLDSERAVVSWLADGAAGAEIRAQAFTPGGPLGAAIVVAKSSVDRTSGFPRMVLAGAALLFAWTETSTEPIVRTAIVRLR